MGVIFDAGAIIPYASGTPITLTTIAGGLEGTVGFVGFGSASPNLADFFPGMAFSMPREGALKSIAAFFSSTVKTAFNATITVRAQLYSAPVGSNIFAPVTGTLVTLAPPYTELVVKGQTSTGLLEDLDIPVAAQTRLLMVFSITSSGVSEINDISGFASAGVNIV